jgi:uncharacterized Zn-finger protein
MTNTDIEHPFIVETKSVSCDGGSGTSGHPNIYLNIGDKGEITCPYCSRTFMLAEGSSSSGLGH